MLLIIWVSFLKKRSYDPNDKRPDMPVYMPLFSALLNIIGSPLFYVGLSQVAGSVFQMMSGFVVVATAILSRFVLKKNYYRQHILGLFLLVSGVAIVGFGGLLQKGHSSQTTFLGIIITVSAQTMYGFVYVVDELIMRKYKAVPI